MLEYEIENLIDKMIPEDIQENIRTIKEYFDDINYTDDYGQSLLHLVVDNKYDEIKVWFCVAALLDMGINPNTLDACQYNFIQTALYTGYNEKCVLALIKKALEYGLDVNHVDSDGDTIMHTAIYSDDYSGGIENIYTLLCQNGFDTSIVDGKGRNLVEAMIYQQHYTNGKQFTDEDIRSFKDLFAIQKLENNKNVNNVRQVEKRPVCTISSKDKQTLEKYGCFLNDKIFTTSPTIGRESETKNLIISLAQEKKNPMLVGDAGVGKTSIVEELAYRIKTNQVPRFLEGQLILSVDPASVVAGCQYVGTFEQNMKELMDLVAKNNIILFIDEIHTIYGVGSSSKKDTDMATMLKRYIDNSDIKVIGATTSEEYKKYFSTDALKRRFDKIDVLEPEKDILYQIIDKVIDDYSNKTGIYLENIDTKHPLVQILVEYTDSKYRDYFDIVNNPDLAVSIIDKALAFAKVEDSEFLTLQHFIDSFDGCSRITKDGRNVAITRLEKLQRENIQKSEKTNILKLDFKKRK